MATYTIREVAQRFHVQTSTLRYYEDQGLLCDVERDDAGRRVYTDSHIGRLDPLLRLDLSYIRNGIHYHADTYSCASDLENPCY